MNIENCLLDPRSFPHNFLYFHRLNSTLIFPHISGRSRFGYGKAYIKCWKKRSRVELAFCLSTNFLYIKESDEYKPKLRLIKFKWSLGNKLRILKRKKVSGGWRPSFNFRLDEENMCEYFHAKKIVALIVFIQDMERKGEMSTCEFTWRWRTIETFPRCSHCVLNYSDPCAIRVFFYWC
jgi:hypothetical protein